MRYHQRPWIVSTGVLVIALVAAWFIAAPLPLRGQNSYLITSGISMQPDIKRGDLVVARKAGSYGVGDVVAYRDPNIGPVLHRIVAEEGGRFVLQGDNNDFLDPYRPSPAEIMGRMVLHVPGVGSWLARAYEPRNAALLAVGAGMLLTVPAGSRQVQRARRRHTGGGARLPQGGPASPGKFSLGPASQVFGLVLAAVAIMALALGGLAYSSSSTRGVSVPLAYEHRGEFTYSADIAGTVYPDGVAITGEPIYRQLTDEMSIRFDYVLTSDSGVEGGGSYRMDAVIRQDDGWSRTLTILEDTAFSGSAVTFNGALDLNAIQAEIDSAREQTGLVSQPLRSYTVDIVPVVTVAARVAGIPVEESYAPGLSLIVEPLVVRVAGSSTPGETRRFDHTSTGTVMEYQRVANTLAFPGYEVDVTTAKVIAQIGLAIAVGGGLLLVLAIALASGRDDVARIKSRYGPLLVALRGADLGDDGRLIEVESIEDLVKVAEREGRMILHRDYGALHQFFVQDVDVTYRYQVRVAAAMPCQPGMERMS